MLQERSLEHRLYPDDYNAQGAYAKSVLKVSMCTPLDSVPCVPECVDVCV